MISFNMLSTGTEQDYRSALLKEIEIGLLRDRDLDAAVEYDGGLPAIPTYAPPPPEFFHDEIGDHTYRCVVLNCGGTNWDCVEVNVSSSETRVTDRSSRIQFKTPSSRSFESIDALVEKMVDLIMENNEHGEDIDAVGLVFAFPQENVPTRYGIDLSLLDNLLAKSWSVSGRVKGILIGERLMDRLAKEHEVNVGSFISGNDAALMLWDHGVNLSEDERIAPLGGVCGSGMNMGVVGKDTASNEDMVINLEIGRAKSLIGDTHRASFRGMTELGCSLPPEPIVEVFVAGDYLLYLFANELRGEIGDSLDIRLEKRLMELIERKGNSEILSRLAKAGSVKDVADTLEVSQESVKVAQSDITVVARKILGESAYVLSLVIASLIETKKLDRDVSWVIPFEGSLIGKGEGVLDRVHERMKVLLPDHRVRIAVDGSSKRAVANLAAFQNFK